MNLLWNPLLNAIKHHCSSGHSVVGMISPYCQQQALEILITEAGLPEFVIVSWKLKELASGVGELSIFEHLDALGVPLYISKPLHAKIYTFSDRTALCGSGNLTARGLGISEEQNIECGVLVDLDLEDEISLRKLRDNAIKVTPELYERFKAALESIETEPTYPEELDDELYHAADDCQYLISSLPATKTPQDFMATCESLVGNYDKADSIQSEIHDICTFNLDIALKGELLKAALERAFKSQPFVQDICQRIRAEESMRFGAVTEFIQKTCRDVPMPFRRDIKETVNTLYNWLCYFFEDLEWHTPGERSQVIYSASN